MARAHAGVSSADTARVGLRLSRPGTLQSCIGHTSDCRCRQDILVATASLREKWEIPLSTLTPAHVERFAGALRTRLLDTASGFGKAYLNLLVDEIRLDGKELRIRGSYGALARAVSLSKEGKLDKVPSFVPVWHPGDESNVRPAP